MDDILWLCVMNGDIIERLIGDDVLRFTGDVVIGITSLEKRINLKKRGKLYFDILICLQIRENRHCHLDIRLR